MTSLDTRVFLWMHETFSHGGWLPLMTVLTVIGSGFGSLLILPLFLSPKSRAFAASLCATLFANGVVVFALKALIRRRRPFLVIPDVHPLIFEAPTDFSCPSGHATGSFTFAVFAAVILIVHVRRGSKARKRRIALTVLMLVTALGISMSRCALGVHFPGDILFGALLGSTIGALGARWHQWRIGRRETRVPSGISGT